MTYTPEPATVRQLATQILAAAVDDISSETVADTVLYADNVPADPQEFALLRAAVDEAVSNAHVSVSWPEAPA
ncbi:hypothetical protein ABR737_01050 [Streptomyces sp. Edi2]|uniref:hypothetical protein n=1 Tax=Streptomyces sp. Edi2 TaxID=3162528 RepID=UPI003305B55E